MGCRRPLLIKNAFHPAIHRPWEVTQEERAALGGGVGFIGAWEMDRERSIYSLAVDGIPVRVWGRGWHKARGSHSKLVIEDRPLWATEYARAISCFRNLPWISLQGQPRSLDTQEHRNSGVRWVLARRTNERAYGSVRGRKRGRVFGSQDELIQKVRYYQVHTEQRKLIAAAGRERCVRSGHSNHEILQWALERVFE